MPEPHPFVRTMRSLEGDRYGGALLWSCLTLVFMAGWGFWLVASEVPVYAASQEARLETAGEVHPVEAPADGELQAIVVAVGEVVSRGQPLFTLESQQQERLLGEEQARRTGLTRQLADARAELESRRRERSEQRAAAAADLVRAIADRGAAESAAKQAEAEAERSRRLLDEGLVSTSEVERLQSLARQRRYEAEAAAGVVERLRAGSAAEEGQMEATLAQARRELSRLEAELAARGEAVERLDRALDRRTVRAPVAGMVAELAPRRVGGQISAGEHLATIIPEDELRVIARFSPAEALGRLTLGQLAEVRMEGFPWTEFGVVDATVAEVAMEPRDGRVRVELVADPASAPGLPLSHGLPGTVLVRVEEVSPLTLLLRSVGHRLGLREAGRGDVSGGEGRVAAGS